MLVVKMMTDRARGYVEAGYVDTAEAKEKVNALKVYYNPIDVYYTTK